MAACFQSPIATSPLTRSCVVHAFMLSAAANKRMDTLIHICCGKIAGVVISDCFVQMECRAYHDLAAAACTVNRMRLVRLGSRVCMMSREHNTLARLHWHFKFI